MIINRSLVLRRATVDTMIFLNLRDRLCTNYPPSSISINRLQMWRLSQILSCVWRSKLFFEHRKELPDVNQRDLIYMFLCVHWQISDDHNTICVLPLARILHTEISRKYWLRKVRTIFWLVLSWLLLSVHLPWIKGRKSSDIVE